MQQGLYLHNKREINILTAAINTKSAIKGKSSAVFMTHKSKAPLKATIFMAHLGIFDEVFVS